ncbi:hypothetical protein PMIN02_003538 [Paraphaeosphaeria minitans]
MKLTAVIAAILSMAVATIAAPVAVAEAEGTFRYIGALSVHLANQLHSPEPRNVRLK